MIILGSRQFALCHSLLFCLLLGCVSSEVIIATVGTDVTLPCNYDSDYYGSLSVCWGRGDIPSRGCANEVIKSDGTSVVSRLSERYLLRGNSGKGDVSLTIRQVEESDSGVYGCRVEIPGWFNDHKHQQTLTVVAVRPNPLKVETREVKERSVTVKWTPGFDGGRPITSYKIDLKNKQTSWDTAIRTEISNPLLTQVTLVDLHPAKTYSLRMFAINSVGMSEASSVLTVTTKEAAPDGPPLDMQLEALTSHSIKVTWKPPRADLRNGVLRSYSISYREYDNAGRHFKNWQHQSVTATRELESIILTNLKPSTKYGVIIQAKNLAGVGPASTAPLCSTLDEVRTTSKATTIKFTSPAATVWMQDTDVTSVHTTSTAETFTTVTVWEQSTTGNVSVPPDPPVVELKEVTEYTISLSWIPGFEGDSSITGYYLEYKAVNASWDYTKTVIDFSPNQTEATIIEVNPSTYNIRMFAQNSHGTSEASNVLTVTTAEAGHLRDSLVTTTPTEPNAAVRAEESRSLHQAAIVVPVVLVVMTVAIVTTWQLRRIKQKQGSMSMWMTSRAIRYRGSESLQEL
ncbi:Down syndrome cell adhesion molecule homolog [Anabas testudineus]|uniref:Down syndrome cell adhesion molecule homolog n=1 Tax=Anabas testudineus TaxID=64144 RepID=UPI000E453BA8|nr:Down syndrome cell adhesion molecule homolog [Anabas testudineus]XP_026214293.1 Down syndrome cell adhesion molecule homolog [Anabas testudineus]